MTEQIKPEVIKRTQDLLGKHIKRPPLTEKLLKKPPFRFLHDIIISVVRETGFLKGLFTTDEMNHENIKDKDSKIAFLQKVQDALTDITGVTLHMRPIKVVAGHEPTKTNEFLQLIGTAIEKKLSSVEYVERLQTKDKKKKGEPSPSSKDVTKSKSLKAGSQVRAASKDRTKSKESEAKKVASRRRSGTDTDKVDKETKKNAVGTAKQEKASASSKKESSVSSKKEASSKKEFSVNSAPEPAILGSVHDAAKVESPLKETVTSSVPPEDKTAEAAVSVEESKDQLTEQENSTTVELQPMETETPPMFETIKPEENGEMVMKRPQSARHGHRKPSAKVISDLKKEEVEQKELIEKDQPLEVHVLGEDVGDHEGRASASAIRPMSARPGTARRSARPLSARPAAPRIRDRGEVPILEEAIDTAPKKVNVIVEDDVSKELDEDDNFLVLETEASVVAIEEPLTDQKKSESEAPQGHLVAQILETQKELENNTGGVVTATKVEIEWDAGKHRERELAVREIDRLRSCIQTLSRAANPLGKLMDFLHEDVDSMQRELENWEATNEELEQQLLQEFELTDQATQPLVMQLEALEVSIKNHLSQVGSVKANIIRNEDRIVRLLTNTVEKVDMD